uniref:Methyltransferase 24 n=1 Tax=mine drainage metagenome TaxID=410659 RepID=E6Q5T5_9ZZZZ
MNKGPSHEAKWPKRLPELSDEQQRISDEFMRAWHKQLPSKYSVVERFNHGFPVRLSTDPFQETLEIGAGLGEHLKWENLSGVRLMGYVGVDLRANMAAEMMRQFPKARAFVGDCQKTLPFADCSFDRLIAIHVLEHLPNLPAAIAEMRRLIRPNGYGIVVIPCEGGLAYSIARKISAERFYKRQFGGSYRWLYSREHINRPREIIEEIKHHFTIDYTEFFPLAALPLVATNICIGLRIRPR